MAILGYFFHDTVRDALRSKESAQQLAAAPPAANPKPPEQIRELLPQTPWTRDTRDWTIPLPDYARAIGIAANGIRSTREKDSERFVFDHILIEMNPAWSHMDYFDVMVRVTYFPADPSIAGTVGGISGPLHDVGGGYADVRGGLTPDAPVRDLRNLSVTVPLPKDAVGRTEVTLAINAVISDPTKKSHNRYTHETSRLFVWPEK